MLALKYRVVIICAFCFCTIKTVAQSKGVSGFVVNSSKEPIEYAVVQIEGTQKVAITQKDGSFNIQIKDGTYRIVCQVLGYELYEQLINIPFDGNLVIALAETAHKLSEVVIKNEKQLKLSSHKLQLDRQSIKAMSGFMGEKDPVKLFQQSSSVQSAISATGIHVRGGSDDQNMMMLDNTIILNPNHLFGFYSVFNPNIIDKMNVYSSFIPAKYGGRVSSVMDIQTKPANLYKTSGHWHTGLLSTDASLELPLVKEKVSLSLNYRQTYIESFIKPLFKKTLNLDDEIYNSLVYDFYDMNGSLYINFGPKVKTKITGYLGQDGLVTVDVNNSLTNNIAWGNKALSSNTSIAINNNIESNLALSYSGHDYFFQTSFQQYDLQIESYYKSYNLKYYFDQQTKLGNKWTYGIENNLIDLIPNNKSTSEEMFSYEYNDDNVFLLNTLSAFLEQERKLGNQYTLNIGGRLNYYNHLGAYNYYVSNNFNQIIDTLNFDRFDIVSSNLNFSPRINIKKNIDSSRQLTFSFVRNFQYLHRTSIGSISLPSDFWLPSSIGVPVIKNNSFSTDYAQLLYNNKWLINISLYYRYLENLIEYQAGLIGDYSQFNVTDNIITGEGHSFGIETMQTININDLVVNISYTYARAFRAFDDIMLGQPYFANYDRPHDLNINLACPLDDAWDFNLQFIYASGNRFTAPNKRYMMQGLILNGYGQKNSYTFPAYHRMDINFTRNRKWQNGWKSELQLGLFNLYSRLNPYLIYFSMSGSVEEGSVNISAKTITLNPLLPNVSYKIMF